MPDGVSLRGSIAALACAAALSACGDARTVGATPMAAAEAASAPARPAPAPAQPAGLGSEASRWVYRSTAGPANTVALVFVHGIFGDDQASWALKGSPSLIDHAHRIAGGKVDVFSFGYPTHKFQSGSLGILEAAESLHQHLTRAGLMHYPHIVFVAHSMGGLITMRYLTSFPEVSRRVPLLLLYGTPQQGAAIANVGDKVLANPALGQLAVGSHNSLLDVLERDWRRLPTKPPRVVCGYETVTYAGLMIVPRDSATRLCTDPGVPITGSDHLTLVKPADAGHDSVTLLANALLPVLKSDKTMSPRYVRFGRVDDVSRYLEVVAEPRLASANEDLTKYSVCERGRTSETCCAFPEGTRVTKEAPTRLYVYNQATQPRPAVPTKFEQSVCGRFSISRKDEFVLRDPAGRMVSRYVVP